MANTAVIIGSSIGSIIAVVLIIFIIYKIFFYKIDKNEEDKEEKSVNNVNITNFQNIEDSGRNELNIKNQDLKLKNTKSVNNDSTFIEEKEVEIYDQNNIENITNKENESKLNSKFMLKGKTKIKFKKKNTFLNSYNNALSSGNTCQAEDKTITEINNDKLNAEKLRKSLIDLYSTNKQNQSLIENNINIIDNRNLNGDKENQNNLDISENENKLDLKLELDEQFKNTVNSNYEVEKNANKFNENEKQDELDNINDSRNLNENSYQKNNVKNNRVDIRILRENNQIKERLMKEYISSLIKKCNEKYLDINDLEIIYSEGATETEENKSRKENDETSNKVI